MLSNYNFKRQKISLLILSMMDLLSRLEPPITDTLLLEQSKTSFAVMPLKQATSSPEDSDGIAMDSL